MPYGCHDPRRGSAVSAPGVGTSVCAASGLESCSLGVTRRLSDPSSYTALCGYCVACVLLKLVTATGLTVGAELGRPHRVKFFLVMHSLTATHPRPAALLFEETGGNRPPEVQATARFTLHSLRSR